MMADFRLLISDLWDGGSLRRLMQPVAGGGTAPPSNSSPDPTGPGRPSHVVGNLPPPVRSHNYPRARRGGENHGPGHAAWAAMIYWTVAPLRGAVRLLTSAATGKRQDAPGRFGACVGSQIWRRGIAGEFNGYLMGF